MVWSTHQSIFDLNPTQNQNKRKKGRMLSQSFLSKQLKLVIDNNNNNNKGPDLFPNHSSISITPPTCHRRRYPSLCLATSSNPIQTQTPTTEMALTRRLGMATVALIAVATAAFMATPADAAKEKRAFIRTTVKAHDIVIFSKSYCPYCKKAKGVFKDLNKEPFVVELDQREDGSEIQDTLLEIIGKRTVPQVFINGKHLGGSDATVEAYESGKLKELLSPKEDL